MVFGCECIPHLSPMTHNEQGTHESLGVALIMVMSFVDLSSSKSPLAFVVTINDCAFKIVILLLVSLSSLLNTPRKMHKSKLSQNFYTIGRNNEAKSLSSIHKVQNFEGYTSTSDNASVTIPELIGAKMVWISAGYNIQIFFIGKSNSDFSMFGSRNCGTGFSLTFDPDTGTITSRLAWNAWDAAAGYCRIGKNIYYLK